MEVAGSDYLASLGRVGMVFTMTVLRPVHGGGLEGLQHGFWCGHFLNMVSLFQVLGALQKIGW